MLSQIHAQQKVCAVIQLEAFVDGFQHIVHQRHDLRSDDHVFIFAVCAAVVAFAGNIQGQKQHLRLRKTNIELCFQQLSQIVGGSIHSR